MQVITQADLYKNLTSIKLLSGIIMPVAKKIQANQYEHACSMDAKNVHIAKLIPGQQKKCQNYGTESQGLPGLRGRFERG